MFENKVLRELTTGLTTVLDSICSNEEDMKSSEFKAHEEHYATLELFYLDGLSRLNCFSSSIALVIFIQLRFVYSSTVCEM